MAIAMMSRLEVARYWREWAGDGEGEDEVDGTKLVKVMPMMVMGTSLPHNETGIGYVGKGSRCGVGRVSIA